MDNIKPIDTAIQIEQVEHKIADIRDDLETTTSLLDAYHQQIEEFDKGLEYGKYMFDEMLDDAYDDVVVCGIEVSASRVLKEVDPIAYNAAYYDHIDSMDCTEFPAYVELLNYAEELEDKVDCLECDLEEATDLLEELESYA